MSIQAKIITFFLWIINAKKLAEKSFQNPPRTTKAITPERMKKILNISEFQVMDKSVVTVQALSGVRNTHILFLHGGAYLIEGRTLHWKIVETIACATNHRVTYIDYPLAPEHTYIQTFEMLHLSFEKLVNMFPEDKFVLMGDSAGGGLALAFAQKLAKEKAHVQPGKLILFSPWLDLSMQNPDIPSQITKDKLLPFQGLIDAGKRYAGGDDTSNYLLSPLNGDLSGLGETLVFYGTDELFCPDCRKLAEKARLTNAKFSFLEFPGMQHDWVVYPIPEAGQAIKLAVEFLLK